MTYAPMICLPVLDGTREATNDRLEAWVALQETDAVEDALYTLSCHLEEAMGAQRGLAVPAEECSNEGCIKAGDVEFLGEELARAWTALRQAQAASLEQAVARDRAAS